MPITLPNLDDRRYADLLEDALARIPVHAPEWTNHNSSDPGIALVELFAYLTEMLIYRVNRVTAENIVAFLNLIDARERKPEDFRDRATLNDEVRKVVSELRKPYRAITREDYNELILEKFSGRVARVFTTVRSLARKIDNRAVDSVSVFVVPALRSAVLLKGKGGYRDHSSDLRSPGRIPFRLLSDKDERLYIGMESKFDAISFNLNVALTGYDLKFEYSKGGDEDKSTAKWAPLPTGETLFSDLTSNWTASGLVVFRPPAATLQDWQPSTVNAISMYWIRVSTEGLPSEGRVATAFQVAVQSVPNLPDDDSGGLMKDISKDLDSRRLLTTRVNVAGPTYKKIAVQDIRLHVGRGESEAAVEKAAREELSRFFHPLIGGRDGKGWPFGRPVYHSEIIERLAGLPGVDYVSIDPAAKPLVVMDQTGKPVSETDKVIPIEPFELVDFRVIESKFITRVAPDPRGSTRAVKER